MKIFCDRSCLQLPLYCFKSITAEATNDNTKLTHSHCLCIAGAAVIDRKKEDGVFSVLYSPKQRRLDCFECEYDANETGQVCFRVPASVINTDKEAEQEKLSFMFRVLNIQLLLKDHSWCLGLGTHTKINWSSSSTYP